jgi:hypothetical protein
MVWYSIFLSYWFYLVMFLIAMFSYSIIRATPLKKLPIFSNRKSLMIAAVVGFLLTSGIASSLGFGSASLGTGSTSGYQIIDVQETTTFASVGSGANCTLTENIPGQLYDVRCTDAQVLETAGELEVSTGVFTIRRTGELDAVSVPVSCSVPAKFEDESAPDGTVYNILEADSNGIYECYVAGGSSSAAATTSSQKMTASLPFAEGVDTAYLGVVLEVDEEGHDALDQYSYKDVGINFGGKIVTFRVHRMD